MFLFHQDLPLYKLYQKSYLIDGH